MSIAVTVDITEGDSVATRMLKSLSAKAALSKRISGGETYSLLDSVPYLSYTP
jgi:hypothetical protein